MNACEFEAHLKADGYTEIETQPTAAPFCISAEPVKTPQGRQFPTPERNYE